jgi:hypothetical protein
MYVDDDPTVSESSGILPRVLRVAGQPSVAQRATRRYLLPARFATRTATAAATFMVTTAAATRTRIGRLRTRFAHGQPTTHELGLVQFRDRPLRFVVSGHLDEGKPTRTAGGHVAHHTRRFDGPDSAEQLLELRFRNVIRKIPNEQLTTHFYSFLDPSTVRLTVTHEGSESGTARSTL